MPYRWVVLSISFFNVCIGGGLALSFPLFYVALLEDLAWSRGATAGMYSVSMVMMAVSYPALGRLVERRGVREVVVLGSVMLGLSLWLSMGVSTPRLLYLTYGMMGGLGLASLSWVIHAIVVPTWFADHRGTASGLLFSGGGVGVVAVAPLVSHLIGAYGWQGAMGILGIGVPLIGVPLNLLLMRNRPDDLVTEVEAGRTADEHALHDGASGTEVGDRAHPPSNSERDEGLNLRGAVRSWPFWALSLAFFCVALSTWSVNLHQAAYLADLKVGTTEIATIVALVGLLSSVGRFGFGWLADLAGRRSAATASILCSIGGIAALMMFDGESTWAIGLYLVLFGAGFGARAPILSAMASDTFGGPHYGSIWGTMTVGHAIGTALGPWLAGVIFDVTGAYTFPFGAAMALLTLAALLILSAGTASNLKGPRRGKRWHRQAEGAP